MPESTICRPEHVFYCFASLEASLTRSAAPDPSHFLQESERRAEYPLFVTWNKYDDPSHADEPHLRGCIGCFSPLPLEEGLGDYALTSALKDGRFEPITKDELPDLQCGVSLLTPFEPARDPLDWSLGTHGIHITFTHHGRRYTGTYLPDVPPAQGWTKEEAVKSLVRKAGYRGDVQVGGELWRGIEMRVYRSEKCTREWGDYVEWRNARGA